MAEKAGEPKKRFDDPCSIIEELHIAVQERSSYESDFWELSRLLMPRRMRWNTPKNMKTVTDLDRKNDVGVLALRQMVDGVLGTVFNPAQRWFQSRQEDMVIGIDTVPGQAGSLSLRVPFQDFGRGLEMLDDWTYAALRRGRYYTAAREFLFDLYGIGNAFMMWWKNSIDDTVVYKTEHMKNVYFVENEDKEIVTVLRRTFFAADELKYVFNRPKDRLPELKGGTVGGPTVDQHKGYQAAGSQGLVEIIHRIAWNHNAKRWESQYTAVGDDKHFIRNTFFASKPFAAGRCYTNSDETYAYGPGHDIMASLLTAQQMSTTLMRAGQLSVRPPLVLNAGFREGLDLTPGAVNWITDNEAIAREMYKIQSYPIAKDQFDANDDRIREAFYGSFFRMISDVTKRMTTVEIMAIQGEKAPLLAGLTNNLETDLLSPSLRGTYEVGSENGMIAPAIKEALEFLKVDPKSLFQTDKIHYTGMLPQLAANYQEYNNIQKMLVMLSATEQTLQDPSVKDNVAADMLVRRILKITQMSDSTVNTTAAVKKIREDRQKAMEAQKKDAVAMQGLQRVGDSGQPVAPGSIAAEAQAYLGASGGGA